MNPPVPRFGFWSPQREYSWGFLKMSAVICLVKTARWNPRDGLIGFRAPPSLWHLGLFSSAEVLPQSGFANCTFYLTQHLIAGTCSSGHRAHQRQNKFQQWHKDYSGISKHSAELQSEPLPHTPTPAESPISWVLAPDGTASNRAGRKMWAWGLQRDGDCWAEMTEKSFWVWADH